MMRILFSAAPVKRPGSGLLALLLWTLGCMLSTAAYARVDYLYLYSETPPERVFNADPDALALQPPGTHTSLMNHMFVTGRPGAFIWVSTTREAAERIAASKLRRLPGATGYIYRIRASESFYDVRHSFEHFLEQERTRDIDQRYPGLERMIEVSLNRFANDLGFVAVTPIRSGLIRDASEFRSGVGPDGRFRLERGPVHNWNNHETRNDFANENPYPVSWPQDTSLLGHLWVTEADPDGWVQAALATQCLSQSGPSERQKRDAAETACPEPPLVDWWKLRKVVDILSGNA